MVQVDIATNNIIAQYLLGPPQDFPSQPSSSTRSSVPSLPSLSSQGPGKGLRGLAWVPSSRSSERGVVYVGNDSVDRVYVFELPLSAAAAAAASSQTNTTNTPEQFYHQAREISVFVPLEGAKGIAGLAYWNSKLLVSYTKPRVVVVYSVSTVTGLIGSMLETLYGFDIQDYKGIAIVPRTEGSIGETRNNPAVYVASSTLDTIVSYNFSRTMGFTTCVSYEL